jgi:DNA adenine methylase
MRFNSRGGFNVPFGRKPERFSKALITKIVNQVKWAEKQMREKDWQFQVRPWTETITEAREGDFIYLDPPYIGRHTDYYNSWGDDEAKLLADRTQELPCGFALSMWLQNRHRHNPHIETCWPGMIIREYNHFYHVGPTEELRNEMIEALVIKPGFAALPGELIEIAPGLVAPGLFD